MYYSSRFDNGKEHVQIDFHLKPHDFITANSLLHPYEYATASNRNWKGFEGVTPDTFEADSAKIENIITIFNAVIKKILKPYKRKVLRNIFLLC